MKSLHLMGNINQFPAQSIFSGVSVSATNTAEKRKLLIHLFFLLCQKDISFLFPVITNLQEHLNIPQIYCTWNVWPLNAFRVWRIQYFQLISIIFHLFHCEQTSGLSTDVLWGLSLDSGWDTHKSSIALADVSSLPLWKVTRHPSFSCLSVPSTEKPPHNTGVLRNIRR